MSYRIYPSNNKYIYDTTTGKPIILAGAGSVFINVSGEPWRTELDTLAANNVNYCRAWLLRPWDSVNSRWAWARISGQGTALDGGNKFDLTQWDSTWWSQLQSMVAYAKTKGIIVEIHLWDEVGLEAASDRYPRNPFNPVNNVNGLNLPIATSLSSTVDCVPEFYNTSNTQVFALQNAYVDRLLTYLPESTYPNVIWEVCNEYTGGDTWELSFVNRVKDANDMLISVGRVSEDLNTFPSWYFSNPDVKQVNIHWRSYLNTTTEVATGDTRWEGAKSKAKMISWDEPPESPPPTAMNFQRMVWLSFVNGGCFHLEGDDSNGLTTVKYLQKFIADTSLPFYEMVEDDSLVSASPGGSCYGFRKTGEHYVWFIAGGISSGSMTVNLPSSNTYTAKQYAASTGVFTTLTVTNNNNGTYTISGFNSYVNHTVVYVKGTTSTAILTVGNATATQGTSIAKYAKYELQFSLSNVAPTDYNQYRTELTTDSLVWYNNTAQTCSTKEGVDVWAIITKPDGTTERVNCFYMLGWEYLGSYVTGSATKDRIVPSDTGYWYLRYAPSVTGSYKVTLHAKDKTGEDSSVEYSFTCTTSSNKGFMGISTDGRSLAVKQSNDTMLPFIQVSGRLNPEINNFTTRLATFNTNGINHSRHWLVNGDQNDIFRYTGTENYWVTNGSNALSTDYSTKRSGNRSATRNSTGVIAEQQFIGCRFSQYYKATVYLKTSTDFIGTFRIRIDDNQGASWTSSTSTTPGQNWVVVSVVFQTNANSHSLFFKPELTAFTAGRVWIDDCSIKECNSGGTITLDREYLPLPGFEPYSPYELNWRNAYRFEKMLETAQSNGVYIMATLFDYRLWDEYSGVSGDYVGMYAGWFGAWWDSTNASAVKCQKQQDAWIRYIIARYGHFTSLGMIELTNEMDQGYSDVRGSWIRGRANAIKGYDYAKRPITNSYWGSPADYKYAQIDELDVLQVHNYMQSENYWLAGGNTQYGQYLWGTGQDSSFRTVFVVDTNSGNAHTGNRSLKFLPNVTTTAGSYVSEVNRIYTKPSTTYTVSMWVKTSGVSGGNFTVTITPKVESGSAPSVQTVNIGGTTSYTQKTFTVVAGSNMYALDIDLKLAATAGNAWVDDVSVKDSIGNEYITNGGLEYDWCAYDEFGWALQNAVVDENSYQCGPTGTTKPYLAGEYGLMGRNAGKWDLSEWADPTDGTKPRHDTTGIHIHNANWATLCASGLYVSPYWWEQDTIVGYNLWSIYGRLKNFITSMPFQAQGVRASTDTWFGSRCLITTTNSNIRAVGKRSGNKAYLWISNKTNTWGNRIFTGNPATPYSASLTIPGFSLGNYTVTFYDTYNGSFETPQTTSTNSNGEIVVSVSNLSSDVAVTIVPAGGDSGVIVNVSPSNVNVLAGSTQWFTAIVAGATNTAVIWTVEQGSLGGSINAYGLYTAPSAAGVYMVRATSVEDPTKYARATVNVTLPPTNINVAISPVNLRIAINTNSQFVASVTGTSNTNVVWSVYEGSTGGLVNANGLYTSPGTPGTYHLIATSEADPSKYGTAIIDVQTTPPVISTVVSPLSMTMLVEEQQQFTATVDGTADQEVTWSIVEGGIGGSISGSGLYTTGITPGVYHVRATSVADPNANATATVTVNPLGQGIVVQIDPGYATLYIDQRLQLSATVQGSEDDSVVWYVYEPNGGTIDADGLYTAPSYTGSFHIMAQANVDPQYLDVAEVGIINEGGGVGNIVYVEDQQQLVTATVTVTEVYDSNSQTLLVIAPATVSLDERQYNPNVTLVILAPANVFAITPGPYVQFRWGASTNAKFEGNVYSSSNIQFAPDGVSSDDVLLIRNDDGVDMDTIGFWKMDDASGTNVNDYGSTGMDGTLINGVTRLTDNDFLYGKCLDFNSASNQYISIPANVAHDITTWTISMWAMFDALSQPVYLIDKGKVGSTRNFCINYDPGGAKYLSGGYQDVAGTYSWTDWISPVLEVGKWYYIVYQRNAATGAARLWVDGVVRGSTTSSLIPNTTGSKLITVGINYALNSTTDLDGKINGLHIRRTYETDTDVIALSKRYKTTGTLVANVMDAGSGGYTWVNSWTKSTSSHPYGESISAEITGVVGTAATNTLTPVQSIDNFYYVDYTGGSDSNGGRSTTDAWKTINKVNTSTFAAGDSILFKRGEVWRETLTVPSTGTSGNLITFGPYGTGALPIIKATDLISSWTLDSGSIWKATVTTVPNIVTFNETRGIKQASKVACTANTHWYHDSGTNTLYVYSSGGDPSTAYTSPGVEAGARSRTVDCSSKDYLLFNYIELSGSNVSSATDGCFSINGLTGADHITLRSVTIKNCNQNAVIIRNSGNNMIEYCTLYNCGRHGVYGYEGSVSPGCDYNVYRNNNIYNCGGYGISIYGYSNTDRSSYNEVYNNTIHDTGDAVYINWGDHNLIHNNTLYHNFDVTSLGEGYCVGIQTGSYNEVYLNNMYDTRTRAVEIWGGTAPYGKSDYNKVYRNYIHGNAIAYSEGAGVLLSSAYSDNNEVYSNILDGNYRGLYIFHININNVYYNNTITNSITSGCASASGKSGHILKNNIFSGNTTYAMSIGTSTFTHTNNCYYKASNGNVVNANGVTYTTSTVSGWEATCIPSNPLLVSSSDWHLQAGSPCRNAGTNVGSYLDYYGTAYGTYGAWDIGASENP